MAKRLGVTTPAGLDVIHTMRPRRTRTSTLAESVKGGEGPQLHSIDFLAGTRTGWSNLDIPHMTRNEKSFQPGDVENVTWTVSLTFIDIVF